MAQKLLVHTSVGGWREPEVTAYENERELQELVATTPDLLTGQRLATASEFWIPGIGSADIVGVGSDGSITIVECKLRANPEIRREVIGQLLAYAGSLWQMSYDSFAATWESRAKKPLVAHVRSLLSDEVDDEDLRRQVTDNLERGSFTLVIAVDEITDELKRIIEYANSVTRDDVRVLGLELQLAKDAGTQILIPRSYGASLVDAKAASAANKTKWNPLTFAAAVDALEEPERSIVSALMEHGREFGNNPWWGVGQVPGMSWYYKIGNQVLSMFQIYLRPAGAVVAAGIGALNSAATEGPAMALAMRDGLAAIPAIAPYIAHVDAQALNRYPSIPVKGALDQPGALAAFLAVVDHVRTSSGLEEVTPTT